MNKNPFENPTVVEPTKQPEQQGAIARQNGVMPDVEEPPPTYGYPNGSPMQNTTQLPNVAFQ